MTDYAQLETKEAVRAALERGEPVEILSKFQPSSWWPLDESWTVERIAQHIAVGYQFRAPLHAIQASDAAVGPVSLNHVDTLRALRGDCNPEGDDWDRQICAALDVAISALAATPAPPEKSKADGSWRTSGLIEALKVRKQIDEDGTLIGVSHQALDEATKILEAIAAEPAPLSEQGKADRDLFLLGTSLMVGGKRVDPWRVTIERDAETREAVAERWRQGLMWLAYSADPEKLDGRFAIEHARRALGSAPCTR